MKLSKQKKTDSKKNYKIGNEKFITNDSGKVESVVIPIKKYNEIIELIEDYGLGLAIKEAENNEYLSKKDAVKYLNNDKN